MQARLPQRPVAQAPLHLFAASGYLARVGHPETPEDLNGYASLFMRRDNVSPSWHLKRERDPEKVVEIGLRPRMLGSCMVTLKHAAASMMGVVALPAYVCRDEVNSGRLQRVLPDWIAADSTITVLMSSRRGMSAATRAFIEHLTDAFPGAVRLN